MSIETGTYISDFNVALPGATDLKSEGDDHMRWIKSATKATFPNVTGAMTATHTALNAVAAITFASGTYTPTLTNGTNIAASTPVVCQYMRVGNVVTVSGSLSATCTSAGVASRLTISLPIASTFAIPSNAGGILMSSSNTLAFTIGAISGVGTTAQADLSAATTSSQACPFSFTYQVI